MNNSGNEVAIYCRVSTQMQSVDRQEEELLKYAEQKGYLISPEHIYKDIISGFSVAETRPEYEKLFSGIERGEIRKVLFSELTRLGRNSVELLKEIERLKELDVELYFKSQNLTINAKQDLGSRILLAVLAVTATYEIELFAERSISGKINRVKMGGGIGGDNNAYGYCNDANKCMQIREDEAKVVERIFTEYANGKSTIEICDGLNADGIPTAYAVRVPEFRKRRREKGLEEKDYKNFDPDRLSWKPNMLSKMLSKNLYTGKRHIVFHKPNPVKKNGANSEVEEKPEVLLDYEEQCEHLRIISDELFAAVQQRLAGAKYNKNNAIKHENLLKSKLVCGECGSNFGVGNSGCNAVAYQSGDRTYECYGRINRKDKPSTCKFGATIRQWKLDGLVLMLSLKLFAERNLEEDTTKRIELLNKDIENAKKVKSSKEKELKKVEEEYKLMMRRYARVKNAAVESLIDETTIKYNQDTENLSSAIEKQNKQITTNRVIVHRLQSLAESYSNLNNRMEQIRNDKNLVKSMVDEFIQKIYVYRINKLWNLIVVKYTNEAETWGTIKSARYRKDETFYDELLCKYGVEFKTWVILNTENCFLYDKDNHLFTYNGKSEIYNDLKEGTYTYEEFHKMLEDTKWIGSYPLYDYEFGSTNIEVEEPEQARDEYQYIDWSKHNEELLQKLEEEAKINRRLKK